MKATVRISKQTSDEVLKLLFSRYPFQEWATFIRCGWKAHKDGLLITVKSMVPPHGDDVSRDVDHVVINEPYILRTALKAESGSLAVGVIHSHPQDYATYPSKVDDHMDLYLSKFLSGFTPGRPYVSLIVSRNEEGTLCFSGRCWFGGKWIVANKLEVVGQDVHRVQADNVAPSAVPESVHRRLTRLTNQLGPSASLNLWNTTVVIVGLGGTGSAVAHSLARSCVGHIVLIDFDRISYSNAERVHGVTDADLQMEPKPYKVEVLSRLIKSINPSIKVTICTESVLSPVAENLIASADIIMGCTDTEHARVAVCDYSIRLLIPAIHVNVALEGRASDNKVTGEIMHFSQFGPGLACLHCQSRVNGQRLAQELMSDEEKKIRKIAAGKENEGDRRESYWLGTPIIPTIGSLTTMAAEYASNCAVGLITGKFQPPHVFLEMNLLAPGWGIMPINFLKRDNCLCQLREGMAGQCESLFYHQTGEIKPERIT